MTVRKNKKPPTQEQSRLGKLSRRKGGSAEREAARLWREFYPHCKRMFPRQQQGVKYPDIGCPDMNEEWYVEVKRRKRITDAMAVRYFEKAVGEWFSMGEERYEGEDSICLLMFRENGKEWHVAYSDGAGGLDLPSAYSVRPEIIIAPWSEFAEWLRNRTEVK